MRRSVLLACLLLSLTACDESTGGDDATTSASTTTTTPTTPAATTATLLNELKINIPDDAPVEYVELKGEPGATLKNAYLLILDGDDDADSSKDGYGKIEYLHALDGVKFGSNGLILIRKDLSKDATYKDAFAGAPSGTTVVTMPAGDPFEHDAVSLLLVETADATFAKKARGDDLDANDDGILELPSDAKVLDSVGWLDDGTGKLYAQVKLTQSASNPDAATRFADNVKTNDAAAWCNGDIYEDDASKPTEARYDANEASASLPPNAKLTPGDVNLAQAPFVLLNEVVAAPPSGNGSLEYVELTANSTQSLENVYFAALAKADKGKVAYAKSFKGLSVGVSGLLALGNTSSLAIGKTVTAVSETAFSGSGALPDAGSFLLVYSPKSEIAKGQDLDANDDGKFELPAGAVLLDGLALGDETYKSEVASLTTEAKIDATAASRFRDNRLVGAAAWGAGVVTLVAADGLLHYDPAKISANMNTAKTGMTIYDGYVTPGGENIAELATILIKPTLETARSTQPKPDADDPVFWLHPADPAKSLVIATQKEAGYSIYNAKGETLQDILPSKVRYNNVDVAYGFSLKGKSVDLIVFSDRINDKLAIYKINQAKVDDPANNTEDPYLIDVTDTLSSHTPVLFAGNGDETVYGICVYRSPITKKFYAFGTQAGHNTVAQFELKDFGGMVGWEWVRTIQLADEKDDNQAEGLAADHEKGALYIAQEGKALFRVGAEPTDSTDLVTLEKKRKDGKGNLVPDIEGVTLYFGAAGKGCLVVSSQGSNSFAVYNREFSAGKKNASLGNFAVVTNVADNVDGGQDTDSLDVTNAAFGGAAGLFPSGALIIQDGQDAALDGNPNSVGTNFKWIRWENVANGLKLGDDYKNTTAYNPRTYATK